MTDSGRRGELAAARHLTRAGLVVVERNFRTRHGEIDLVARDGDCVVFVEVRVRSDARFGGAAESITARKRERVRRAAAIWLSRCDTEPPCRFDAVLIGSLDPLELEWIRNAFD